MCNVWLIIEYSKGDYRSLKKTVTKQRMGKLCSITSQFKTEITMPIILRPLQHTVHFINETKKGQGRLLHFSASSQTLEPPPRSDIRENDRACNEQCQDRRSRPRIQIARVEWSFSSFQIGVAKYSVSSLDSTSSWRGIGWKFVKMPRLHIVSWRGRIVI